MGSETYEFRSNNMAIGNVADPERGRAWWAKEFEELHFDGSVPLDVVRSILGWKPVQVPMGYIHPITGEFEKYAAEDGPRVVLRDDLYAPVGYNGGASNLFDYWDWFINGPQRILDTHSSDLNIGFAGLFKNGSVAAVQIELAKTIVDDKTAVGYRPFLYAASSLDGSLKPHYGKGVTRIVCENTFAMARGEAEKDGLFYGVKQTRNRELNVDLARSALQIVHGMTDDITAELHKMCETAVSDRQWSAFLDAYTPLPEKDGKSKSGGRSYTMAETKREELTQLWNSDMRAAPWRNTAFGVSQAATTWAQHTGIVRGAGRIERNKLNMITGKAADVETEAMRTLDLVLSAG